MGKQTKGFCKYCGKEYTRGGMIRHLTACKERKSRLESESGKRRCGYFELTLSGYENNAYWLIIEMKDTATLRDLDIFIRDIWVECCGHLSAFYIQGVQYEAYPDEDCFWGEPSKSMNYKLKGILSEGMTLRYEYDYGAATELTIKVQDYREGVWKREKVTILSRNNPFTFLCSNCGKNKAEWVSPEGIYTGMPFWCEECAEEKEKEGEYFSLLPVCNSPRMGECGYEGSDIYPDQFEPDKTESRKE